MLYCVYLLEEAVKVKDKEADHAVEEKGSDVTLGLLKYGVIVLALAILLSIVLYAAAGINPGATLRAVFGLIFILFLPGYVLCWLLFPTDREINHLERAGLGLGMSIPVLLLVVLTIDRLLGVELTGENIVKYLGLAMAAMAFTRLSLNAFKAKVSQKTPSGTLDELAKKEPEVLKEQQASIARQLGMLTAESYVFGHSTGKKSVFRYDPAKHLLSRADDSYHFHLPQHPESALKKGNKYVAKLAEAVVPNLELLPGYHEPKTRETLLHSFRQGFLDQHHEMRDNRDDYFSLIEEKRSKEVKDVTYSQEGKYRLRTSKIIETVDVLIEHDSKAVVKRLLEAMAKAETKRQDK